MGGALRAPARIERFLLLFKPCPKIAMRKSALGGLNTECWVWFHAIQACSVSFFSLGSMVVILKFEGYTLYCHPMCEHGNFRLRCGPGLGLFGFCNGAHLLFHFGEDGEVGCVCPTVVIWLVKGGSHRSDGAVGRVDGAHGRRIWVFALVPSINRCSDNENVGSNESQVCLSFRVRFTSKMGEIIKQK